MDDKDNIVFFFKKLSCQFLKVTRCDFIKTSAGSPLKGLPQKNNKHAFFTHMFFMSEFFFHMKKLEIFF